MPPRAAHKTAPTANGRRYPGPGRRPPGQQQGRSGGGTGSQRWQEAEARRRPARERAGVGAGSGRGSGGRPQGGGRQGPSRHLPGAETKPHSSCGEGDRGPCEAGSGLAAPPGAGSGGWTAERRAEDAAGERRRRGNPLLPKDWRFWIVDMRY